MILACPLCQTRFLVSASVFAAGPRPVRCARCSHSWKADLTKHGDNAGVSNTAPVTGAAASHSAAVKKQISPRAQRIKYIVITVIVLIPFLVFVLDRKEIADRWPSMEDFYDKIGLHIYYFGEGLSFTKMRSELVYEGGIMKLVVDGNVLNTTGKTQEIPNITATAIGADGQAIQSWQIDAPASKVAPKEAVPFHSTINAPKGTVTDINLRFLEMKDESP